MADSVPVEVADEAIVDAAVLAPQGQGCPSCGAPVDRDDRFCNACGNPLPAPITEERRAPQRHFQCKGCGSRVSVDADQRSYVCPFCDSTYVVEFSPDETGRQRPEFVIGFALTQDQALEKFRQWIRTNGLFRPGDLGQAKIERRLRGIYLPFWSFSMLAQSRWKATIGEYWYRTETYTTTDSKGNTVTHTRRVRETEWWTLSGRHHHYYNGYLVSGSKGLPQSQADRIKPFQLPALKRYEPFYLAGWLSEEYSIERDEALARCRQEFHRQEQANVSAFLPGDTFRNLSLSTEFSQENSDLILLPVYLLSYRYQDKLYRFLINGQTGRLAGDKPLSWRRIWSAVGAAVGVVVLIILVLFLLGAFGR